METILELAGRWLWGPATAVLLIGTGLFFSVRLRFFPWRRLKQGLGWSLGKDPEDTRGAAGDVSPFASLCTTLAATIGTGNITGVASALVAGGPGALVWMWISAALGITTQFTECALAVKYRLAGRNGEILGGPMITMERGLPRHGFGKRLGCIYAVAAVTASFGIGNLTQSNSMAGALETVWGIPPWAAGTAIALAAGAVISGGVRTIARVSSFLVPGMALFYLAGGTAVILLNIQELPGAVLRMFHMAFSFRAVGGGIFGCAMFSFREAMRIGMARGFSSNEAGTGSSGFAAAAAHTRSHIRQGCINMTGTFWDTFVICSVTGLAILTSGAMDHVWDSAGHVVLQGPALTVFAFSSALGPAGGWLVSAALVLFGFSTLLGWEYNGEKALEYLTDSLSVRNGYRLLFAGIAFLGCVADFGLVWNLSDILNILMLLPNTLCIWLLLPPLAREVRDFERCRTGRASTPPHRRAKRHKPAKF